MVVAPFLGVGPAFSDCEVFLGYSMNGLTMLMRRKICKV